jgi:hypothetical protein
MQVGPAGLLCLCACCSGDGCIIVVVTANIYTQLRAQRFASAATATLCAAVRCRPGCDRLAGPIQHIKTILSLSALHTCTAPAAFVLSSSGQAEDQLAGLMQPIKTISLLGRTHVCNNTYSLCPCCCLLQAWTSLRA